MSKEWRICKDEKKIADSRFLFEACIMKLTKVWGGSYANTKVISGEDIADVDKFLFGVCVDYMVTSILVNLECDDESPTSVKTLAKLLFENYEFIHGLAAKVCDDLAVGLMPARGKGNN